MYDIPENGIGAPWRRWRKTGVTFLTVHAVGSVMRAAAVAAREGSGLRILGVTVLTSFGPEDMDDLGYDGNHRGASGAAAPGRPHC